MASVQSSSRGTSVQPSKIATTWALTEEQLESYDLELQEQRVPTTITSPQVESTDIDLAQSALLTCPLNEALQLVAEEQQTQPGDWLPVAAQGIPSPHTSCISNQDSILARYQPDFSYHGAVESALRPEIQEEMWLADVPQRRLLVSVTMYHLLQ